tara:strand:+ start:92 stop:619 length:528 start_codon:yes stop_codon:yes gene_type:complete
MGDLMDMLDLDMGLMNRKDCDKEIEERDDAWKRKLDDLVRQNVLKDQESKAKVEAMRKKVIQACNEQIKKLDQESKAKVEAMRKRVIQECNEHMKRIEQKVKKAMNIRISAMINNFKQIHNERMKALMNKNNQLKAENAKLAEAVSRTAAAMTLSRMPRKRRKPGFKDLGNPSMW